jgi:hypothetical protein
MWSPASTITHCGRSRSIAYRFCQTASAVPRYQCSPVRFCGGSTSTNSPSSWFTTLQPMRTWRLRLCALYWVAMKIRRRPELMQFESVKSIRR